MNFDLNTLKEIEGFSAPKTISQEIIIESDYIFPLQPVSKKTFIVNPEQRSKLYSQFNERQILIFNKTKGKGNSADCPEHVFNHAEYYAETGKYFFSEEQICYMKQNTDKDIEINAYGLERAEKIPDIFSSTITSTDDVIAIDWAKPEKAIMHTFKENSAIHPYDGLMILYLNIPYEYYKDIYTPEKLYQYDMDTRQTFFCWEDADKNKEQIQKWMTDFVSGIYDPFIMKVTNGTIVSVENMIPLLAAKYLKLPAIPVTVVVDRNMHEFEYMTPEYTNKELANKVFGPYLWIR